MATTKQNTALYVGIVALVAIIAIGGYAMMNSSQGNLLDGYGSSSDDDYEDGMVSSSYGDDEEYESSNAASVTGSESNYPPLSRIDQQKVEAYLGANINKFVTTPSAVLGGKFYVTNIDWYTENAAIVSYTDDEKALRARVVSTVNGEEVKIVSFTELAE